MKSDRETAQDTIAQTIPPVSLCRRRRCNARKRGQHERGVCYKRSVAMIRGVWYSKTSTVFRCGDNARPNTSSVLPR